MSEESESIEKKVLSPRINKISWGSIKIEGFGEFKDVKLYPDGRRQKYKSCRSEDIFFVLKLQKNGIGQSQKRVMNLVFYRSMFKIYSIRIAK